MRGKADNPDSRVRSRSSKKGSGNKGHCYANQRALLCKPSRDEDSRKLTLAVVLDQGLAKKTQETKGHCYANQGHCYANQVVMRIHAN